MLLFLCTTTSGPVFTYFTFGPVFTYSTFGSCHIFVVLLLKLLLVVLFLHTATSGPVLTYPTSSGPVLTYPTSSGPIVVMYLTTSGPVIMYSTTIGPTTCIMYMPCRKIYSTCGPDIEVLEVLNYIGFYMLEHTQQWILLYPSGYKVTCISSYKYSLDIQTMKYLKCFRFTESKASFIESMLID